MWAPNMKCKEQSVQYSFSCLLLQLAFILFPFLQTSIFYS